jgi:hypothetical protein
VPLSAADYYLDPAVRARVLEFCGAAAGGEPTAAYVVEFDTHARPFPTWETARRLPVAAGVPWTDAEDLSRSLWDTAHLVYFIELDYLNVDQHDEPFRHPADVFLKLEPTYQAARLVFARYGMGVRTYASGRGYHFIGTIGLWDPLVDELAALVPATPGWWPGYEARRPPGVTAVMSERQARAADGLGLLIEHTAHLLLREARRASTTPVVFNGTKVGRGLNGRACVSIDFSHAGDPLDTRHVRTGFSTYQWHRYRPDIFGDRVASDVPPLAVVPRHDRALLALLTDGRSLAASRDLAQTASATLPDVGEGVGELLQHYRRSALAAFHRRFLNEVAARRPADLEPSLPTLPGCGLEPLVTPNDLLLQPAHLQHVTRLLLVRGWTASRIAALVQSCYEADHAWGDRWRRLHAPTRAAFDVRVFAGMVEAGLDTLTDFNCVSAQEKDLCPGGVCPYNLLDDRDRLQARCTA